MDIERSSLHGWNGSNVLWCENMYPQDIAELLIEAENVEDSDNDDENNNHYLPSISDDGDVDLNDFDC